MTDDTTRHRDDVLEAFPQIESIGDERLREGTIEAWTIALAENDVDDIERLQWYPPRQERLGTGEERLVDHVTDVVELAVETAEVITDRRPVDLSMDLLLTGALVHDVSKVYEYSGHEPTAVDDLLGHPYFGIAVVAMADLPTEIAHIVLAHSPLTAVEPASIEALIVSRVDEIATAGIKLIHVSDLREV